MNSIKLRNQSSAARRRRMKIKRLIRSVRIGNAPADDPFVQKVQKCLSDSGFSEIKVEINGDYSFCSFCMSLGANAPYRSEKHAHSVLLGMFRRGGIAIQRADELAPPTLVGNRIAGAFVAPENWLLAAIRSWQLYTAIRGRRPEASPEITRFFRKFEIPVVSLRGKDFQNQSHRKEKGIVR